MKAQRHRGNATAHLVPQPPVAAAKPIEAPANAETAAPPSDPSQGQQGARRFGAAGRRPPRMHSGQRAALESNLKTQLAGALTALGRGQAGPMRGRLKAAASTLDALAAAGSRTNLSQHRPALTKLAAGPNAALATAMLEQLDALESVRLLDEVASVSPTPRAALEALIEGTPEPAKIRHMLASFYPGAEGLGETKASLRAALDADLAQGGVAAELKQILTAQGVSPADQEGLLGMMSEVRAGFGVGTKASGLADGDRDMQRTNWIHTRVEVLKAARAFETVNGRPTDGADPARGRRLLSVLAGTLSSDAFKDASGHSLLWHNRPGAELVLPLLASRHLPEETAQAVLPTAMRLAHEHQITPAFFMAGAMRGALTAAGVDAEVIEEIAAKVGDPLNAPHKNGEVLFSEAAQAGLRTIGLSGWATMDRDSPHFADAQVVAFADVLQYAAEDGLIKIAIDIRDPRHPLPFMRDGNIKAAIDSSLGFSFSKGLEAIEHPALLEQAAQAGAEMKAGLQNEVYPEVDRRLRAALGVPDDQPLPGIPYWNEDVPTEGNLSEAQAESVALVKSTLRDVLAERGSVPLNPFGQNQE